MNTVTFEEITIDDIQEVREIYNYYVMNSTISFHTEELNMDQMRESVLNKNPKFKSCLIKEYQEMVGYVLLAPYKNKQAYDVSAEVTIYLKPDYLGQGIGSKAIAFIEGTAREQGFHTLIATICMENARSIKLFEKNGYEQCALFKEVGYKFGRRLDIGSFQKIL
ncbi:phosphinothricin acetyltransferase [Paenibacillus cellulosilyticus]|uniref:Phosphinothricin acetyltransferase n=1 Tax=Paenibacillus cellulosilyticus TaxID=375489 RepID=A0A2V2YLT6_9BACL|nr:GNAT family N-acetyltransferase [Paenibacillus cellulosilyticus]PWV94464.1 phosphinothricin acetyltransferase [Paenibacillus cellulosilyticus]